jgi:hypothetical protein
MRQTAGLRACLSAWCLGPRASRSNAGPCEQLRACSLSVTVVCLKPSTPLIELIPVLQVAIAPVILISGVGLLLLSLTNRFGRAVDRTRQIHREMRVAAAAKRLRLANQVEVIYRRARLIQLSIIMGALSALFAAMLILALFLTALMKRESAVVISLFLSVAWYRWWCH